MKRLFASIVAALLLFAAPRLARADASVDLYTIGPGSYLFSRYGHSLLCVRDAEGADGRCYDYGIPDRDEAVHMTWSSIRGEPIFVPARVAESVVVRVFGDQGRAIEKQRLSLTADEAARLSARLESDVRERRPYAYHPYFSNCTTQVRDRLDEITGGRLRPGKSGTPTARFRDLSEEGLSGRLGELFALALLLGDPAERRPSPWELMFLPEGLRDAVTERFAAPPTRLMERQAVILPTSRAVGRLAIFFTAVLLYAVVRWGARRPRRTRLSLGIVGGVLGGMALFVDAVALLVVWPEFRHNWALVALLPTDLALPFLPRRALRVYATVRLAMGATLFALEVASVVAQPLMPVAVLVMVAMAAVRSAQAEQDAERVTEPVVAGV